MEELNKGYKFTKSQIAELESLRAWKAEIEKQEPVGEIVRTETSHGCDRTAISWLKYPYAKYGAKLYLSPVVSPDVAELQEKLRVAREALEGAIDGMGGSYAIWSPVAKQALALALPNDDTALKQYRDSVIEECALELCNFEAGNLAYLIRKLKSCKHEWDSNGDPGPGETMTLTCRYCGKEQQAKES